MQGILTAKGVSVISLIRCGTIPISSSIPILFSLSPFPTNQPLQKNSILPEIYERAQAASAIVSISVCVLIAFTRGSIALQIFEKAGRGLPLHKFESAQRPCLTIDSSIVLLSSLTRRSTAPQLIILSLLATESPEMFPIPQIALQQKEISVHKLILERIIYLRSNFWIF